MTPNELLAGGYRMGRQMVRLMCDDLTESEFHHQPVPGTNSAAWIVGHLAVVAGSRGGRFCSLCGEGSGQPCPSRPSPI